MKYPEFLQEVQKRTGLNEDRADLAIRAFMGVLADRLPRKEVHDLASQLPLELKGYLSTGEPERVNMNAYQFFERIADAEGTGHQTARQHGRAVWQVLEMAVKAGEMGDVLERLPANVVTDLNTKPR